MQVPSRSSLNASSASYSLVFPAELSVDQVVAWLQAFSGTLPGGLARLWGAPHLTFELWATAEHGFRYRLTARRGQADYVVSQLRTALPGVRATPTVSITTQAWTRVAELGTRSHTRSLRISKAETFSAVLLSSLRGLALRPRETVVLQVVVRPAIPELPPAARAGRPAKMGALIVLPSGQRTKDAVLDQRRKLEEVNFLAAVRVGVYAATSERADHLLAGVRAAFGSVRTAANTIYMRSTPQRRAQRRLAQGDAPVFFPMQLAARELAGLLAWPIGAPNVAGLPQSRTRHLAPSGTIVRRGLVVAQANFPGAERPLAVTPRDMCKHLHIIGPTGAGKTVLAGRLVAQAMAAGSPVIVTESKGDLYKLALEAVPRHRLDDVIVVDVADTHPVGYNLLSEGNPRVAIEELCQLFEYLYPDMRRGIWARAALHRGLSTLITKPGMTFIDLVPLLSPSSRTGAEQQWRTELIGGVQDRELRHFWERFDGLSPQQQEAYAAPILDRVWQLNERPEIRNIIGQGQSSFSMGEVLRSRKVLLVNLSGLGVETGRLAGTLLLNSLYSAVRRGAIDPDWPAYLFLDEFQDFLNLPVDPETMLVQARSYGLSLVLSHQHLDQLPAGLRSAVLVNAASKVVFRTGADDARTLAREFGRTVSEDDFLNLGQYEVLAKLATSEGVSPAVTGVTLQPMPSTGIAADVLEQSRKRYGRSIEAIDTEIERRRTPVNPKPPKRPRLGRIAWDSAPDDHQ